MDVNAQGSWSNEGEHNPYRGVILVNGQRFEVEPGTSFAKALHKAAAEAGLQGRWYVYLAREAGAPAEIVRPETAPAEMEGGFLVKIAPFSQGA